MSRRSALRRPEHPLAGRSGRVKRARLNLYDALDGADAPCHWCERPLVWRVALDVRGTQADDLCVDHLDGDILNDDPLNLVPSCRGCNGNRDRYRTERQCEWCDGDFMPRRPESRFCSVSCSVQRQWAEGRGWSCKP